MAELHYVDWDGLVYYDGKVKQYIGDKLQDCLKMGGLVTYKDLPSPSFENLNYIYQITEEFISSEYFKTPGYEYSAGTWVQVADFDGVYLYSIFNEATIGGTVNLSNYYTKRQTEDLIESSISTLGIEELKTSVENNIRDIGELQSDVETLENTVKSISTEGFITEDEVTELLNNYITDDDAVTEDELAAKGYLTSSDLNGYAKTEDIPSLEGFATEQFVTDKISEIDIPEVPTKVSELENDAGYITVDSLPAVDKEIYTIDISGYTSGQILTPEQDKIISCLYDDANNEYPNNPTVVTYIKDTGIHGYWHIVECVYHTYTTPGDEVQVYLETAPIMVQTDEGTLFKKIRCKFERGGLNESSTWRLENSEAIQTETIATEQFVTDKIAAIDIPDTSSFITMQDVEGKGYLTEHQDISGKADVNHKHTLADIEDYTEVDLTSYALKTEIPSVEGLATEDYVNEAVANMTVDTSGLVTTDQLISSLEAKANDVLFTTDMRVGNAIGGFVLDDSLMNMSISAIITKLLNLTEYIEPETPEGSEITTTIIKNSIPMYNSTSTGGLEKAEFTTTTWTEEEANVQMDGVSTFYTIVDDSGAIIESGYQQKTTYNEEVWLTIALPDIIENVIVKMFNPGSGSWEALTWNVVKAEEQTIDGYTIWTVPEKYEVMAGGTYRFVIVE